MRTPPRSPAPLALDAWRARDALGLIREHDTREVRELLARQCAMLAALARAASLAAALPARGPRHLMSEPLHACVAALENPSPAAFVAVDCVDSEGEHHPEMCPEAFPYCCSGWSGQICADHELVGFMCPDLTR